MKINVDPFLNYYRPRCHILCLQETHSVKEDENIWQNEWGGRVLFCHGTNKSRGTMICVNKNNSAIQVKLSHTNP